MTQDELIKLPDAYECVMWSSRKRDAIYRKAPMGRGTVPTLKNRRRPSCVRRQENRKGRTWSLTKLAMKPQRLVSDPTSTASKPD